MINGKNGIHKLIPKLGTLMTWKKSLIKIISSQVVLAMEKSEQSLLENIINRLSEKDVEIKIQPNTLDILSGSVKTSNVMGAPLIDLKTGLMPEWQQNIKRLIDVIVALCGLITTFTIMLICSIKGKTFLKRTGIFIPRKESDYKGKAFYHV